MASPNRRLLGDVAGFGLALPMVLFLALPMAALVMKGNLSTVAREIATDEVRQAAWLSLRTTGFSLLAILLLGTPLAVLLGRRRFRGHGLLQGLVELPAVMPPAAAGLALLLTFGRKGILGEPLHISLGFTTVAVVLAQIFVAVPVYVRAASAAMASLGKEIEDQAATDGASSIQAAWHVILPAVRGPIAGGAILAWARALGEFGATILFAGNLPGTTQTMPLALYIGFEQDLDRAIALAVLLLAVAAIVLFIARAMLSRWEL